MCDNIHPDTVCVHTIWKTLNNIYNKLKNIDINNYTKKAYEIRKEELKQEKAVLDTKISFPKLSVSKQEITIEPTDNLKPSNTLSVSIQQQRRVFSLERSPSIKLQLTADKNHIIMKQFKEKMRNSRLLERPNQEGIFIKSLLKNKNKRIKLGRVFISPVKAYEFKYMREMIVPVITMNNNFIIFQRKQGTINIRENKSYKIYRERGDLKINMPEVLFITNQRLIENVESFKIKAKPRIKYKIRKINYKLEIGENRILINKDNWTTTQNKEWKKLGWINTMEEFDNKNKSKKHQKNTSKLRIIPEVQYKKESCQSLMVTFGLNKWSRYVIKSAIQPHNLEINTIKDCYRKRALQINKQLNKIRRDYEAAKMKYISVPDYAKFSKKIKLAEIRIKHARVKEARIKHKLKNIDNKYDLLNEKQRKIDIHYDEINAAYDEIREEKKEINHYYRYIKSDGDYFRSQNYNSLDYYEKHNPRFYEELVNENKKRRRIERDFENYLGYSETFYKRGEYGIIDLEEEGGDEEEEEEIEEEYFPETQTPSGYNPNANYDNMYDREDSEIDELQNMEDGDINSEDGEGSYAY